MSRVHYKKYEDTKEIHIGGSTVLFKAFSDYIHSVDYAWG